MKTKTPVKKHDRSYQKIGLMKKVFQVSSSISPLLGVKIGLHSFLTPKKSSHKKSSFPSETRTSHKLINNKNVTLYRYNKSVSKVLLIHGWEGAANDFSHFFEPLAQQGYEVMAIDLPGHGQSAKNQLNAVEAAHIIKELEIKYGPFNAIIAHSFGAFSTGYALSKFSELKNIPFVSIGSPNKLKHILGSFTRLVGFSPLQTDYLFSKLEKDLHIRINECEHAKFIKSHAGPTLVVHDKRDAKVPFSVIHEIKKETMTPDFLLTEGLGHQRILKDNETITSIINFINQWKDSRAELEMALRYGLI